MQLARCTCQILVTEHSTRLVDSCPFEILSFLKEIFIYYETLTAVAGFVNKPSFQTQK
jgi:hypothetical protein